MKDISIAVEGQTAVKERSAQPSIPLIGQEYLESLNDGREVWIYGEKVKDVTKHPAFRNSCRMIARLYDASHDPVKKEVLTMPTEDGGFTHRFYRAPRNVEEQVASRDAIADQEVCYCVCDSDQRARSEIYLSRLIRIRSKSRWKSV